MPQKTLADTLAARKTLYVIAGNATGQYSLRALAKAAHARDPDPFLWLRVCVHGAHDLRPVRLRGRGHADKGRGGYADCRRKYVREEVLDKTFAALLDRLHFDEEVLDWVRDTLKASHADERREQEQAIQRCQTQYKRLEDRLQAMYLDKLDGRIDNAFYDRMSAQWRVEQTRLLYDHVKNRRPGA